MGRVNHTETFFKDVRYGLRVIRRRPGFAFVAMVTLALGIGANSAIFSLVNGVLLRPLPYADSDRLVRLTEDYPKGAFAILRDQCQSMDLAAYWPGEEFNLAEFGGAPVRVTGAEVSADFFSILGVRPVMGRTFHTGEDAAGNDNVVILSHALLQEQFGGDPFIIGRSITIEGQTRQVVGVMRPDFRFPSADTKLWVPLKLDPRNTGDFWGPQMPIIG